MNGRTTITIRQDTYQRLCKQGTHHPDSFNEIIARLLDLAEKEQKQ